MVTAASSDGWLACTDTGVVLGPRLPVLAHHSNLARVLRDAQPVVDAVAGVTGLFAHAYVVVGHGVMPVLSGGRAPVSLPRPPGLEMPIWSIAAGRAAASLMAESTLKSMLPDGPLPATAISEAMRSEIVDSAGMSDDGPETAESELTRRSFLSAVDHIRHTGVTFDVGDFHPMIHCVAVPWPGLIEPAALCVIGTPADVTANADLAEAVLREAVQPGGTRDRVVQRAADFQRS